MAVSSTPDGPIDPSLLQDHAGPSSRRIGVGVGVGASAGVGAGVGAGAKAKVTGGTKRKGRTSGGASSGDGLSPEKTTRTTRRSAAAVDDTVGPGLGDSSNTGGSASARGSQRHTRGSAIGVGAGSSVIDTQQHSVDEVVNPTGAGSGSGVLMAEPSRGEEQNLNVYDFKGKGKRRRKSSPTKQPSAKLRPSDYHPDPSTLSSDAGPSTQAAGYSAPPLYIPPYPFGLTPYRYSCLHPSHPAPPPGDPANPKLRLFDPYAYRSKEAIAAVRAEPSSPLSSDDEDFDYGLGYGAGAIGHLAAADSASSQDQGQVPARGQAQAQAVQQMGGPSRHKDTGVGVGLGVGVGVGTGITAEAVTETPTGNANDPADPFSQPLTDSELATLNAVYNTDNNVESHDSLEDAEYSNENGHHPFLGDQAGHRQAGVIGSQPRGGGDTAIVSNDNNNIINTDNPYDIFNDGSQQALQSITALLEASGGRGKKEEAQN